MIRSPYLWLLPAALLALAVIDMPYGYYGFMRLCVCISSAMIAGLWFERSSGKLTLVTVIFALIALLYNPIIRVHLDRSTWAPINLATAVAYILGYLHLRRVDRGQASTS